jgi:hypothetical protein
MRAVRLGIDHAAASRTDFSDRGARTRILGSFPQARAEIPASRAQEEPLT